MVIANETNNSGFTYFNSNNKTKGRPSDQKENNSNANDGQLNLGQWIVSFCLAGLSGYNLTRIPRTLTSTNG